MHWCIYVCVMYTTNMLSRMYIEEWHWFHNDGFFFGFYKYISEGIWVTHGVRGVFFSYLGRKIYLPKYRADVNPLYSGRRYGNDYRPLNNSPVKSHRGGNTYHIRFTRFSATTPRTDANDSTFIRGLITRRPRVTNICTL